MKKRGENSISNVVTCAKCGEGFEREGAWQRGEVVHCEGKSWAFDSRMRDEAHHAPWAHPRCWACGAALGCPRCSGKGEELLCLNIAMHQGLGAVWATRAALVEHGVFHGQRIEDYPADWRPTYVRSISAAVAGRSVTNINELVRQIAD